MAKICDFCETETKLTLKRCKICQTEFDECEWCKGHDTCNYYHYNGNPYKEIRYIYANTLKQRWSKEEEDVLIDVQELDVRSALKEWDLPALTKMFNDNKDLKMIAEKYTRYYIMRIVLPIKNDKIEKTINVDENNKMQTTLQPSATLPTRGSPYSAGLDLYALKDTVVDDILESGKPTLVSTGVSMMIPDGYWGNIRSRSGLSVKHSVFSEAGVVDSDYRGEIKVALYKIGSSYTVKAGERIAQLIIVPHSTLNPVLVDSLNETQRGAGGFGSTGK